ncbi:hypothetical protein AB4395_17255 [Vibrio splendidus]
MINISKPIFYYSIFSASVAIYIAFVSTFLNSELATASVSYFINIIFYLVLGCLFYFAMKKSHDIESQLSLVIDFVILCALFNGVIILLEFLIPSFRVTIESILLSSNSNIDYLERNNRFRGLASGGAANLSLFYGFALVSLYYQLLLGRIKSHNFIIAFFVIFMSCLLIGRTGLVIAGVGVFLISILSFFTKNLSTFKSSFFIIMMFFILPIVPIFLSQFMTNYMLDYALMFFYSGFDGIKSEGTVDILAEMTTYPDSYLSAFIGVGSDSGGFLPNTRSDSGYLKMFTTLGYPLAIILYCLIAYVFINSSLQVNKYRWVLLVFIGAWFFSEIKEPFIFKGYTARFLWFTLAMLTADIWNKKNLTRKMI